MSLFYLYSFRYMPWSGMSLIMFVWCIVFFIDVCDVCWNILTSIEWNRSWCKIFFFPNQWNLIFYDLVKLGSKVFTENFYSYIHQWNWSIILSVVILSLSCYGVNVMLPSQNSLIVFHPFLFHGKVWRILLVFLQRSGRILHQNH
jgi:hypothetical protein